MKFLKNGITDLLIFHVVSLAAIVLGTFMLWSCEQTAQGNEKISGKWQMKQGEFNGKRWVEELYFEYHPNGTYSTEVPAFPEDNVNGRYILTCEGENYIPVSLSTIETGRKDTTTVEIVEFYGDSMIVEYDLEDHHSMRLYLTRVVE